MELVAEAVFDRLAGKLGVWTVTESDFVILPEWDCVFLPSVPVSDTVRLSVLPVGDGDLVPVHSRVRVTELVDVRDGECVPFVLDLLIEVVSVIDSVAPVLDSSLEAERDDE